MSRGHFRFHRRVKIAPGCYVNIGKRGSSFSFGVPGLSLNMGKRGTYLNSGLPGTGLSYRQRLDSGNASKSTRKTSVEQNTAIGSTQSSVSLKAPVFTNKYDLSQMTSPVLVGVKQALVKALTEAYENSKRVPQLYLRIVGQRCLKVLAFLDFSGKRRASIDQKMRLLQSEYSTISSKRTSDQLLRLQFNLDAARQQLFERLKSTFDQEIVGQSLYNVGATLEGERLKEVSGTERSVGFIDPTLNVPAFECCNGLRLYVYPRFVMLASGSDFALLDYRDLRITSSRALLLNSGAENTGTKTSFGVLRGQAVNSGVYKNNSPNCILLPSVVFSNALGLDEEFLFNDENARDLFFRDLSAFQRVW